MSLQLPFRPAKAVLGAALLAAISLSSFGLAFAQSEADRVLDGLVSRAADASEGVPLGNAMVTAPGGIILKGEDACRYSANLNADEVCETSAIVFPPDGVRIDSIYYHPAQNIGHVNMDDWTADVNAQIDEIWESYREGAAAQSERIGYQVTPVKWVLYPTLDKDAKVMTYGVLFDFDGQRVINLTSVKLTRKGYTTMEVVTDDTLLAENWSNYSAASNYAARTYTPTSGMNYADVQAGDKVAAIGAVGVLAALVSNKKGPGGLAAWGAAIMLFMKKFWFVLLAIPAALLGAIKRFFAR